MEMSAVRSRRLYESQEEGNTGNDAPVGENFVHRLQSTPEVVSPHSCRRSLFFVPWPLDDCKRRATALHESRRSGVLTRPFRDQNLLDAIQQAMTHNCAVLQQPATLAALRQGYEAPQEQDVIRLVVSGLLNKQTATTLGTSEITLKVYHGQSGATWAPDCPCEGKRGWAQALHARAVAFLYTPFSDDVLLRAAQAALASRGDRNDSQP